MDFLADLPLPAALGLLALVDGLSIGTLLIPLFFLVAPGPPRIARILTYLGTIVTFYLLVGVLFTLGLVNMIEPAHTFLGSKVGQSMLLFVGVVLFVIGVSMPTQSSREKKRQLAEAKAALSPVSATTPSPPPTLAKGNRLARWRTTLLEPNTSKLAIAAVAVVAGITELAGMLPYLVGMTMLADAPLAMPTRFVALAGYCLVMITPALLLLVGRVAAARAIDPWLRRFTAWFERTSSDTTAWILAIIGFLLARAAATELGIMPFAG